MLKVEFMKPFYTKVSGGKLRLVFAYQYFSITRDGELFHFIPIEGKEMIINLTNMQVENMSEVFVFQRENQFIRLPLYQLMLISNTQDHLMKIIEPMSGGKDASMKDSYGLYEDNDDFEVEMDKDIVDLIGELTNLNIDRMIDKSLEDRDEVKFKELIEFKKQLLV